MEGSAKREAVALQVAAHFLVVLSENSPSWQDLTHRLVDVYPKVNYDAGHKATHLFVESSA